MSWKSLKSADLRPIPYMDINGLQACLEDGTEGLVRSIQSLHANVRSDADPTAVKPHLDAITTIVGKMVSETQHTTQRTSNKELRDQVDPVVKMLVTSRTKMMEASAKCAGMHDMQILRRFNETLPPLAFDIARETRELVQRLDHLHSAT